MQSCTEQKWAVVFHGVDRSDASAAFRGTQWDACWFEHSSPIDYDESYSPLVITIEVSSLDDLIAVLALYPKLQAESGATLYATGTLPLVTINASLCTANSGFALADINVSRRPASVASPAIARISEIEDSLHALKNMIAVQESCGNG